MRGKISIVMIGVLACTSAASAAVTFDTVIVGNPGNAADATGHGSVAYTYQIGKYEVTNSQYAEFLNAKAASDPLGLYSTNMSSSAVGGITRSGSSASYTYAVKPGHGNQPVVFVSWFDSIRFANWMNNGRGAGDTESGAYTLLGGTPTPSNANSITRNSGATIVLPSWDEWYKAAYHQPSGAGGDIDNYWLYATRTNAQPNSDQPPGDPSIQSNVANFYRDDGVANGYNDGYAVTGHVEPLESNQNYLTDVGAYSGAGSYYGTFDQGGNVSEWTEYSGASLGGSWFFNSVSLQADSNTIAAPSNEAGAFGFRLASIPEPSGIAMIFLGAVGLLRRKRPTGAAKSPPAPCPVCRSTI
jgi:formylglycine-generating enzyme required for sulfatase activity